MKAIGGLGVLIFLVIMVYWLSISAGGGADGKNLAVDLPIAFGNVAGGQVEMNLVVGIVLANVIRAKEGGQAKTREQWIADHFVLKDSSGQPVKLTWQNNSALIKPVDVGPMVGTEECFLAGKLKPGESYTFEYIESPNRTCRYQFTAPAKAQKVKMYRFEPVNSQ